jgi:hypothetical protein
MSARLASFDQNRTELTPGTVLVREWDRQSQRVMVMAEGFTSELNNIYYKVEFVNVRGQPRLTFKRGGSTYEVHRGSWADKLDFSWPR